MNKVFTLNGEAEVLREFDTNAIELDHVPVIQLVVQPHHLVVFTDQVSPGAEKFRVLALRLRNFQKRQQLKKLLVTSSIKGEGKSVVSANLAVTLAQQGQRILLIDCDLHQSGLRDLLGSRTQPGLSDWWSDSERIVSFLRRVEGLSLWYLAAGRTSDSPMEVLQSQRFADMLSQVASLFDFVIIDSPPLVPVADSTFLAGLSDGSLIVVRQAITPKPLLKEALKTENLKPLGIVANEWNDAEHRYYGQYYKSYSPTKELDNRVPISVEKSN